MKRAILFMAILAALVLSACSDFGLTGDKLNPVIVGAGAPTAVTGVTLNRSAAIIGIGGTEQLAATIAPANATNTGVTWTTTNAGIASVIAGLVTGVANGGPVTITATSADGSFISSCAVTVTAPIAVAGVSLNKTRTTIAVAGTESLIPTINPANATDKTVTWSTSASGIATVSGGVVTGVSAGEATISATTTNGSKTGTCIVTVSASAIAVTGVSLNKGTTTMLVDGGSETLYATLNPIFATNQNVTWSSSNASLATVDSSGKVTSTGAGAGSSVITVTTSDGSRTASCTVSLASAAVPVTTVALALSKTTALLIPGGSEQLSAVLSPAGSTTQNVIWTSSDATKVSVDATGLITGIAAGTSTITVTTVDGSRTANCTVTVSLTANSWMGLAASTDGSRLYAVANQTELNPGIFASSDFGYTWKQVYKAALTFWTLKCSSDGKYIVAIATRDVGRSTNASVLTSSDFGTTWTDRTTTSINFTAIKIEACAISDDGTKILLAVFGGKIYTSSDSGATFTDRSNSGNWTVASCSSSGSVMMVASSYSGGSSRYSTDSGGTWTSITPYSANLRDLVISKSGTQVAMTGEGGLSKTSNVLWSTWTEVVLGSAGTTAIWHALNATYNADGTFKTFYAGTSDGTLANNKLYKSTNLTSWSALATYPTDQYWVGINSTPDGNIIVALSGNGIYVSINANDATPVWTRKY